MMDRHDISILQRAVKKKARKVKRPACQPGVVYCTRCLKSNYQVEFMLYDSYFNVCSECVERLFKQLEYLRAEKQKV